ncbi:hypothethical protein (plasmid) [Ralstonia solanacearum CMR15]|nr:hypothethical protein [Ralstonia solanacearum CMR15]
MLVDEAALDGLRRMATCLYEEGMTAVGGRSTLIWGGLTERKLSS